MVEGALRDRSVAGRWQTVAYMLKGPVPTERTGYRSCGHCEGDAKGLQPQALHSELVEWAVQW